ncbi:MAG: hypothetical protein ACR2I5_01160, partial [Candidatus Limnocylindria bacterium]
MSRRRRTAPLAPVLAPVLAAGSKPNRLRPDVSVRLKAGHDLRRDRSTKEALDLAQKGCLIDAHQGDRSAGDAGAARTPDPVHVVGRNH